MKCHPAAALAPLLLLLALSSTTSLADQTDQRLNTLFSKLHSPDQGVQITAERQIWAIWFESGTNTIDALMSSGRKVNPRSQSKGLLVHHTTVIHVAQ